MEPLEVGYRFHNMKIQMAMRVLSLLVLVLAFSKNGNAIVNGQAIFNRDYPWAVSVQRWNQRICGGSVISPRHVLTARHCVAVTGNPRILGEASNYVIQIQDDDALEKMITVGLVKRIHLHPTWENGSSSGADMAILELKKPIDLNRFQLKLVSLPKSSLTQDFIFSHDFMVAGWGIGSYGGLNYLSDLLPLLSTEDAPASKPDSLRNLYLKSFPPKWETVCNGDSGGGLLAKNPVTNEVTIIGIVSTTDKRGGDKCIYNEQSTSVRYFDGTTKIRYPYADFANVANIETLSWIRQVLNK